MNILVQLLYGLSFCDYSESFTYSMYFLTRNCMARLLVDDDSRLMSSLLFDCKVLVEVRFLSLCYG